MVKGMVIVLESTVHAGAWPMYGRTELAHARAVPRSNACAIKAASDVVPNFLKGYAARRVTSFRNRLDS